MIFNVTEDVDDKCYFLNMALVCGMKEVIGVNDIVEVKIICESGAHARKTDQFWL